MKIENLTIFLLSNVFSYLLYQRNLLVLHASAISFNSNSFFFCGRSGVGKSTLLNKILSYGDFISEDVTCFDRKKESILNSIPFIKLDTKHKIKNSINSFKTVTDSRQRIIHILEPHKISKKNKIKCGFFLKIGEKDSITKISSISLLKNILANAFVSYPLNIEDQKFLMDAASTLFKDKEFYEVIRRKEADFDIKKIMHLIGIMS